MTWTIERKLTAGVLLVGSATTIAVGLTWQSSADLRQSMAMVANTRQAIGDIETAVRLMADAQAATRGFIITGQDPYLDPYRDALARIGPQLQRLDASAADSATQRERLTKLREQISTHLEWRAHLVETAQTEGLVAAQQHVASGEGKVAMDTLRAVAGDMIAEAEQQLLARQAVSRRNDSRARIALSVLALLIFGTVLTSYGLAAHHLRARRQAEDDLRRLNQALEGANRELEAFSYSVSHDLRAPLRHIHGYVEMLKRSTDGQLGGKSQRYLDTIADASREMATLIDDLLTFSRMSRTEMRQETVDLSELVHECIAGLETAVAERHVDWQVSALPQVVGDRAMLKQVLVNLLDNGVKYTRPRKAAIIEVGSGVEENGYVSVFVKDNGVGFDPAYTAKLFGVFQRLHRADEFEGTGIGLANVRRIISRHGGRTWAEGQPDKGAVVYFTVRAASGTRDTGGPGT